jgi:hypothetical protein
MVSPLVDHPADHGVETSAESEAALNPSEEDVKKGEVEEGCEVVDLCDTLKLPDDVIYSEEHVTVDQDKNERAHPDTCSTKAETLRYDIKRSPEVVETFFLFLFNITISIHMIACISNCPIICNPFHNLHFSTND